MARTSKRAVSPAPQRRAEQARDTRLCVMWPSGGPHVNMLSYGDRTIRTYRPSSIDPRAIVTFVAQTPDDVIRGLHAEPGSRSAFAVPVPLAIQVLGLKSSDFADA